jgi:hypothetical protein
VPRPKFEPRTFRIQVYSVTAIPVCSVAPCSLAEVYGRFIGPYCRHLQDRTISQSSKRQVKCEDRGKRQGYGLEPKRTNRSKGKNISVENLVIPD